MPSKAANRVLTDHEEIRKWVEERGGSPARVKGTGGDGDVGMLRIDFPGYSGEGSFEHISWDEFFQKFDENGLALLVQDETASGERSNFNKLVSRETARQAEQKTSGRSARGRSRTATQTRGTATSAGRTATSAGRKKTAKTSGRSRSATTTARTSAVRKKAGSTARSQAKKKTATRSASRKANAKSKPRAARKTSGSQKIITMRSSKSASSATEKSSRGKSGRRRAA